MAKLRKAQDVGHMTGKCRNRTVFLACLHLLGFQPEWVHQNLLALFTSRTCEIIRLVFIFEHRGGVKG